MSGADRMRTMRDRRVAGIRVLPIEVQIETVETLVELDYIEVEEAYDPSSVAEALGRFIEDTASAVTCHGITLDSW